MNANNDAYYPRPNPKPRPLRQQQQHKRTRSNFPNLPFHPGPEDALSDRWGKGLPRPVAMRSRRALRLVLVLSVVVLFWSSTPLVSWLWPAAGSGDESRRQTEPHNKGSPTGRPTQQQQSFSQQHGVLNYRSDGLVEGDEDASHPIYHLIERAEKEWKGKLRRASKTLQEAVIEYRRRYHRNPPKGFDKWWEYVKQHNVRLPDEYNHIYEDLEPFWGLSPRDLVSAQRALESKRDSFTLAKNASGHLDIVAFLFHSGESEGRNHYLLKSANLIVELMRGAQDFLPDNLRLVVNPHDGPNRLTDWNVKQAALEAASARIYVSPETLSSHSSFASRHPQNSPVNSWLIACSSDSPSHKRSLGSPTTPQPLTTGKKTFIYDHELSMDPCLHPSHFAEHGQFLSHGTGKSQAESLRKEYQEARAHVSTSSSADAPEDSDVPSLLHPEFSYCGTTIHHDIRLPSIYAFSEDTYPRADDPPFMRKEDERLMWRGSNTGIFHAPHIEGWRDSHRERLVRYANDIGVVGGGEVKVLVSSEFRNGTGAQAQAPRGQRVKEVSARKSRLNLGMMDVAFTGEPILCEPQEVCDEIRSEFRWEDVMSLKEGGKYRYIMDVDGNGWSGRFKRLITSNSLILKSTIYPEWYLERVQPWLHYVPVQVDLSDLYDIMLFFRGDLDAGSASADAGGALGREELARKIAVEGRKWSKMYWRREDLVSYYIRLFLEWGRLLSEDRERMGYVHP